MPKWRERQCERCKKVEHTASKSTFCLLCSKENVRDELVQHEKAQVVEWGYQFVSGPTRNKFNKSVYRLIAPCCGSEYEVVFNNLRKQIQNARDKNLPMPCGTCGPKHRMKVALDGFMDKYAIDYDLDKANYYRRLVRRMTEQTYKKNKRVINPNDLPRGRNTGYHIDHVVPIIECFKQGWSAEQASDVSNLQMLEWSENLSKGSLV